MQSSRNYYSMSVKLGLAKRKVTIPADLHVKMLEFKGDFGFNFGLWQSPASLRVKQLYSRWKVSCPDYIHYFNLGFYWDVLGFMLDSKVIMAYANEKIPKRKTFFSKALPTLHSLTLQHLTTPPLLLCLLPHTGPLHQGGGGAGGIHGLKEIIIDWCGPGCWFSWTAAPRGLTERKKDSHHWLSFTFSSSWHICKARCLVFFTFLICLSQGCLSYSVCVLLWTYASHLHYLSVNMGGRPKSQWPHQSHHRT